jgi:hypothetical protein
MDDITTSAFRSALPLLHSTAIVAFNCIGCLSETRPGEATWVKSVFFSENLHLIESNDHESWLIISRKHYYTVWSSGKFKRSSVASQTGLPGKGGG